MLLSFISTDNKGKANIPPCQNKSKYGSWVEANVALDNITESRRGDSFKTIPGSRLEVYFCPRHQAWHIGTAPVKRERAEPKRDRHKENDYGVCI